MRALLGLFSLLLILVMAGCEAPQPTSQATKVTRTKPLPPIDESTLPERYDMIEANLSPSAQTLVAASNGFGVDLYRTLSADEGDILISPASIWTALSMAQAGASGGTAGEFAKVLRTPSTAATHAARGEILGTMRFEVQGRSLLVNNALWVQQDMPLLPAFSAVMDKSYGAAINKVDYKTDPNAARLAINRWVEEKTRGRISDILDARDVTKDTRATLVNTAYFKARWRSEFNEGGTQEEDFFRADGSPTKKPLMHQTAHFPIISGPDFQAIALPYEGDETEMIILLPSKPSGLRALEASLTDQKLNAWMQQISAASSREVILTLPKFGLALRQYLGEPLGKMGLSKSLSTSADFSGMTAGSESDPLFISRVVHQTFIEVDERGTEAAAATAVDAAAGAAIMQERPKPIIFRADHPFLFMIRDSRTGMILFMGRYMGAD